MSGANAFLQNAATENLASQGAIFGFSGLTVVGDTTLIGSLNATGGLSTTTISMGYSTSTGSTQNFSRGNAVVADNASAVTITNSLVSTTSTVLAISATNDLPGVYVSNVVCNNGSFTINLSANNTIDSGFLINWIVFN